MADVNPLPPTDENRPQTLGGAASKRAIRTFLQQLAIDVLVAVALLLLPVVSDAHAFDDFDWPVLLFSLAKTAVVTALSFAMRYFKVLPRRFNPRPPERSPHPGRLPGVGVF